MWPCLSTSIATFLKHRELKHVPLNQNGPFSRLSSTQKSGKLDVSIFIHPNSHACGFSANANLKNAIPFVNFLLYFSKQKLKEISH